MPKRLSASVMVTVALWSIACDRDASSQRKVVWFADERLPVELHLGLDLPRLGDLPKSPDASDGRLHGRWFRMKNADRTALVERLSAVPYLGGYKPPLSETIIPIRDRQRSDEGLNFYTSGHGPEALLADMDGRVVHRWTFPFAKAFPDQTIDPADDYFRRAYLFPNGDVLAIFEGRGLIKIDRHSRLMWRSPIAAHHEVTVAPDGSIMVLSRELTSVHFRTRTRRIVNDFISFLDPDGRERRRISIFDALAKSKFASTLRDGLAETTLDVLHTNSISVIDASRAGAPSWRRPGNVIVSILMLNLIAVVEPDTGTIVQAWKGRFKRQHDPHLLDNGDILVFDNQGPGTQSRVLQFDPVLNEIRWQYDGTAAAPFFSRTCGTVQRLPNGNTLITESDSGRAFEVTADRTIVWEFNNPHRVGRHREYVAALLAMTRVSKELQFEPEDEADAR